LINVYPSFQETQLSLQEEHVYAISSFFRKDVKEVVNKQEYGRGSESANSFPSSSPNSGTFIGCSRDKDMKKSETHSSKVLEKTHGFSGADRTSRRNIVVFLFRNSRNKTCKVVLFEFSEIRTTPSRQDQYSMAEFQTFDNVDSPRAREKEHMFSMPWDFQKDVQLSSVQRTP
jgi:hypothetical protein